MSAKNNRVTLTFLFFFGYPHPVSKISKIKNIVIFPLNFINPCVKLTSKTYQIIISLALAFSLLSTNKTLYRAILDNVVKIHSFKICFIFKHTKIPY